MTETTDDPLFSSYADDEDMLELVEMFVMELPDRIASIEASLNAGDVEQLRVYAHQLKGSAGSYGFQVVTEAAGELEAKLKAGETNTEALRVPTDTLLGLLARASAEPQP